MEGNHCLKTRKKALPASEIQIMAVKELRKSSQSLQSSRNITESKAFLKNGIFM